MEFLTRGAWLVAVYLLVSMLFVNVYRSISPIKTGLLISLDIVTQFGAFYKLDHVGTMRDATDFVLHLSPQDRMALYFRARVLEKEGKTVAAEAVYRRIIQEVGHPSKISDAAANRLQKLRRT